MIVDNSFQLLPLDEQPAQPSELAARVAVIERENPKLAEVIRNVIEIAETAAEQRGSDERD